MKAAGFGNEHTECYLNYEINSVFEVDCIVYYFLNCSQTCYYQGSITSYEAWEISDSYEIIGGNSACCCGVDGCVHTGEQCYNCLCGNPHCSVDNQLQCEYCTDPHCKGECLFPSDPTVYGDGANIGKKYEPTAGDKLFKDNFTQTMYTQMPNTCVTSIMEYVNHLFGGNLNEGVFWIKYAQLTKNDAFPDGKNVINSGVDLDKVESLVSTYFNLVNNGDNIITILNNGGVVMTDTPSTIGGSSHNVLIVGYNNTEGVLIYMDPECGYLKEAGPNEFSWHYIIGIKGNK